MPGSGAILLISLDIGGRRFVSRGCAIVSEGHPDLQEGPLEFAVMKRVDPAHALVDAVPLVQAADEPPCFLSQLHIDRHAPSPPTSPASRAFAQCLSGEVRETPLQSASCAHPEI